MIEINIAMLIKVAYLNGHSAVCIKMLLFYILARNMKREIVDIYSQIRQALRLTLAKTK